MTCSSTSFLLVSAPRVHPHFSTSRAREQRKTACHTATTPLSPSDAKDAKPRAAVVSCIADSAVHCFGRHQNELRAHRSAADKVRRHVPVTRTFSRRARRPRGGLPLGSFESHRGGMAASFDQGPDGPRRRRFRLRPRTRNDQLRGFTDGGRRRRYGSEAKPARRRGHRTSSRALLSETTAC